MNNKPEQICKPPLVFRLVLDGVQRLLFTCLLAFCFPLANAEPHAVELQNVIERQAYERQVCAVAYAVVHAGQISSVGGASGCEGGRVPTQDSVFQAASLSKPVFAYAVLTLAREGALDLDAPLVGYLPQGYLHIQNLFSFGRPPITDRVEAPELQVVTARMVLSHTSGLPNWSRDSLAFDFKPGTDWQYSGEGFMLLQRVVESVTNKKLEDFMRHQLFEPLGMSNTAFLWKPQFADARMGLRLPNRLFQQCCRAPIACSSPIWFVKAFHTLSARILTGAYSHFSLKASRERTWKSISASSKYGSFQIQCLCIGY